MLRDRGKIVAEGAAGEEIRSCALPGRAVITGSEAATHWASIRAPSGVRKDSGWNCTPQVWAPAIHNCQPAGRRRLTPEGLHDRSSRAG